MAATNMHATTEELLEAMFSVRSVPRLQNKEQLRLRESLETAVTKVGGECEIAASLGVSWSKESPASKDVNMKAEEATGLETVTRRQPVKTQQAEET
jgi:hypothetical protein